MTSRVLGMGPLQPPMSSPGDDSMFQKHLPVQNLSTLL